MSRAEVYSFSDDCRISLCVQDWSHVSLWVQVGLDVQKYGILLMLENLPLFLFYSDM